MKLTMKYLARVLAGVVVAVLLVLTAWGNAVALLAFSAIGLAVWVAVPGLRRQIGLPRGLLAGAVSVAVACGVAILLILSRGQ
jgi:hypothetical protein